MNRKSKQLTSGNKNFLKSISFVFFLYWFVLVIWQNVGGAQLRGVADTGVKSLLLLFLCGSFLSRSLKLKESRLWVILAFTAFQMFTLVCAETINFSILISYCFTFLFLLLTYGVGNDLEISQHELMQFFTCIILVVMYTILYTVIMEPEQYTTAFGASTGYGSEFHSFFISNNEFAIYCFYGMVASVVIIDLNSRLRLFSRLLLLLCASVFLFHIILSFSRVTMVCAVAFLIAYVVLHKKSKCRTWVVLLVLIGVIAITTSSTLRTFVYEVAFKSGNVDTRERLFDLAIRYFKEGSAIDMLFGHGITATRAYFTETLLLGSVHNGYMQVLLYFGIFGIIWMVAMLISQLIDSLRMLRTDKFVAAISVALLMVAAANMVTSTQLIFTSPIDSFFVTAMFIVVPKYMRNASRNGNFYSVADS